MQFDVPLGQPARVSLVALAILFSLFLAYVAVMSFAVNSLTTAGVTLRKAEVEAAARYFPSSPDVQALVAFEYLAADRDIEEAANRAEAAAIKAANLSPNRYDLRQLVALAQEMKGDRAGAEKSLRQTLALAPNRVETHWRMANALLREGKLDEAAPYFQRAISDRHALISQSLNLVWSVSGARIDKVEAIVGNSPKGRRDLAFFLVQRGFIAEGSRIFESISRDERLKSDESGAFVSALIQVGQLDLARRIWGELVTDNPEELKPIIFNGGFERTTKASLNQFNWYLDSNDYVQVRMAAGEAHSGTQALRLDFKGVNTTRIDGEIRQQLLVRPGSRYRLTCWVKTGSLQSPSGPQIVMTRLDRTTEIAKSEAIASGSNEWRPVTLEFQVPVSDAAVLVQVKRIPKFSYDEPTKGTIWLDDFELKEIVGAGLVPARQS